MAAAARPTAPAGNAPVGAIEVAGVVPRVLNAPLRATPTELDGAKGYLVELGSSSVWIDAASADRFGRKLLFD